MEFIIEGTVVKSVNFNFCDETDAKKYVDYVKQHDIEHSADDPLEWIKVIMCDDGKVDVDYQYHGEKFERIRRITGKRIAVHN